MQFCPDIVRLLVLLNLAYLLKNLQPISSKTFRLVSEVEEVPFFIIHNVMSSPPTARIIMGLQGERYPWQQSLSGARGAFHLPGTKM